MINTVIIEDNQKHVEKLNKLLKDNFSDIHVLAVCITVNQGINAIRKYKPQLVFLDVQLEPGSGFEVLEETKDIYYETIFTTSFNKYAVKAFKFCALDYIIKPFGAEELKAAIERYKNLKANGTKQNIKALLHNYRQIDKTLQIVGIPVLGGIDFIIVSEIVYCKASSNYTEFYLANSKKLKATKTLKWIEDLLSEHVFFRVHENCLINLSHIKKYFKGGEGGYVLLTGDNEVSVARRRKDEFLKTLAGLKIIAVK